MLFHLPRKIELLTFKTDFLKYIFKYFRQKREGWKKFVIHGSLRALFPHFIFVRKLAIGQEDVKPVKLPGIVTGLPTRFNRASFSRIPKKHMHLNWYSDRFIYAPRWRTSLLVFFNEKQNEGGGFKNYCTSILGVLPELEKIHLAERCDKFIAPHWQKN